MMKRRVPAVVDQPVSNRLAIWRSIFLLSFKPNPSIIVALFDTHGDGSRGTAVFSQYEIRAVYLFLYLVKECVHEKNDCQFEWAGCSSPPISNL